MVRFFLIPILTLLLPSMINANPAPTVGPLIDPERVDIQGLKNFDESKVKHTLMADLDVIVASVPTASRTVFINTLKARLKAGLMNAGYVDSTVLSRLSPSGDRLVLTVVEGSQYTISRIVFEGVSPEVEAKIRGTNRLTEMVEQRWVVGQPVPYAEPIPDTYRDTVRRSFEDIGFFFTEFDLKMTADVSKSTVELNISVQSLGRLGVLNRLMIEGVPEKNHPQVLSIAQLKSGTPINAQSLGTLITRLQNSGRFEQINYRTVPQKAGQGVDVILNLTLHSQHPPLENALSKEQDVMLKFAHWSQTLNTSNFALHFRRSIPLDDWGIQRIELGVSPRDGIMLHPHYSAGEGLLILKPGQMKVYAPNAKSYCSGPGLTGGLQINLKIGLNPDEATTTRPAPGENAGDSNMSFNLGLGIQSKGEGSIQMDTGWSPAAAVVHARQLALIPTDTPANVTLRSKADNSSEGVQEWAFERKSGRLLHMTYSIKGQEEFRIWATEQGFQLPDWESRSKDLANVYDADRPLWSCLGFAAQHLLPIDGMVATPKRAQDVRDAFPVLIKISRDVIHTLFPGSEDEAKAKTTFELPESGGDPNNLLTGVILGVFTSIQGLFEAGTWPSILFRQAVMVLTQRTESIGPELQRLSQDATLGPLGQLAFAKSLGLLGHPAAGVFAEQGLQNLSNEAFIKDVSLIYRGQGKMAIAGRSIIKGLQGLSDDERKNLVKIASETARPQLLRALSMLSEKDGQSIEETIDGIVPLILDAGLRRWTEKQLKAIPR